MPAAFSTQTCIDKKWLIIIMCALTSAFIGACRSSQGENDEQSKELVAALFPSSTATTQRLTQTTVPIDTETPSVAPLPAPTGTSTARPTSAATPQLTISSTAKPTSSATAAPSTTVTPGPTVAASSTPRPTVSATAAPITPTRQADCLNAAYVADVTIPDDSRLESGQTFVKTWRVRNNGTCPWPTGAQLVFSEGARLDAADAADLEALDVEQTADVSVTMVAPDVDGRYQGSWRFRDQEGELFGTYLTVVIVIGEPTPTSPPPAVDTPTSPAPVPIAFRNGGFEADWSEENSHRVLIIPPGGGPYESQVGNIFTPPGWTVWFVHQEGVWAQPEGRDAWARDPNRMRGGGKGYVLFTFHRTHDAGLYQQVNVTPGSRLRFSAWGHAWSNHDDPARGGDFPHPDDPRWSEGAGYDIVAWPEGSQPPSGDPQVDARTNITLWVGIDPTGGTNPLAGSVIWSQGWYVYNGYAHELAVEATAQSSTVTVFTRSRVKWPFKHNDVYWDDARLDGLN